MVTLTDRSKTVVVPKNEPEPPKIVIAPKIPVSVPAIKPKKPEMKGLVIPPELIDLMLRMTNVYLAYLRTKQKQNRQSAIWTQYQTELRHVQDQIETYLEQNNKKN